MDAWTDEGRVYLLDREPVSRRDGPDVQRVQRERAELDAKMVLVNATSFLLERSRFEAATALYACELELVVGDAPSYVAAPVWVNLKAPVELVFTLENFDRDTAWFVREAIAKSLPPGYEVGEFVVQARHSPAPNDDEQQAA